MLYNLAIVVYDLLVHFAAPFSRKPRKMMKGHWVVYELLRQQVEKGGAVYLVSCCFAWRV